MTEKPDYTKPGGTTDWNGIINKPSTFPPEAHQLDSPTYHTVSGLTTGTFLKALTATTFGFAAHGLTYADVGADQQGAATAVYTFLQTHASLATTAHGGIVASNDAGLLAAEAHKTTEDAINGLVSVNGAGAYSAKVIGTDVQAYNASLAAIAGGTWTGASSITTLGTIATGSWNATAIPASKSGGGITSGLIPFSDGSALSSDTSLTWDNTNKRLGVGITPLYPLHTGANGATIIAAFDSYGDASPGISIRRALGTITTPLPITTGLVIFQLRGNAYTANHDGSNGGWEGDRAVITQSSTEAWYKDAPIGGGFCLRLFSRPNGTAGATTERIRIDHTGNIGIGDSSPSELLSVAGKLKVNSTGFIPTYGNVTTAGWGIPAIYAHGRYLYNSAGGSTGSYATYTLGANDGSFLVSANINTTAFTGAFTINAVCNYTDETNASRTLTIVTVNDGYGLGPYPCLMRHIRAKAGTTIVVTTAVTFTTSLQFNYDSAIIQIA